MKSSKTNRFVLVSFVLLGLVIGVSLVLRTSEEASSHVNDLRFSNTATWGAEYVGYADRAFSTKVDPARVSLPNPPLNDSDEVKRELSELRQLRDIRTEAMATQIREEITLHIADFYGEGMARYFDATLHPETAPALNYAWGDLETLIMREKRRFDRVRPHILAPDLQPAIEVPRHPSYPSGHSSQAHFFALVLSEIYPERREVYEARAREIARNREVAGVHYRSDSAAGELLARQYIGALKDDETFLSLLMEGRAAVR